MSETDEKENVEYQIGANDIDKTTSLGDDSEFIEFNYEGAAVFKRLADDIYKSKEAGIREPLQNAITAVKRAINEHGLDKKDGVIKIEVHQGEKTHLNLIDNGIGISKDVLERVLSFIGRSQNRDKGNLSGKYGMGFLACYKLVGTDGGFIMHTNSRENDQDPIKGVWKPGGFEIDNENKLPDKFGSNDYGTRFEFKVNATAQNIREWVEKHSEWASLPIVYEEYDENGQIVKDENYGLKSLGDDADMKLCIENESFRAVCSPRSDGDTLLLNSPISSGVNQYVTSIGWYYDIRFKNENGIIVSGPNEGLEPVKEAEYNSMDDNRKSKYIKYKDLADDDIHIPEPTGTRDDLSSQGDFWDYIQDQFVEKYNSEIKDICNKVSDINSYINLSENEQLLLSHIIDKRNILYETNKKTKKEFKNEFGVDVTDEFVNVIRTAHTKVWFVNRGASKTKASRKNSSQTDKIKAIKCDKKCGKDGTVYMAVTLNQDKMDAIWEDSEDNVIVRIESSDMYDEFNEHFGWSKMRYITRDLSELDISDQTKDKLKNDKKGTKTGTTKKKNSDRELKERHLTVHDRDSRTRGLKVEEVEEKYDSNSEKFLVLFPSNEKRNLSEHKYITSENVAVANCIIKVHEYLEDVDNIYSISDWIERSHNIKLKTSEGKMKIDEMKKSKKDILFHTVDKSVVDAFQDDTVMEEMKTIVRDQNNHIYDTYRCKLGKMSEDNIIYVPLKPVKIDQIRSCFGKNTSGDDGIYTLCADRSENYFGSLCNVSSNKMKMSDIFWYAWARLPRWRNTKEIECLDKNNNNLTPDWVWLIDNIANSNYEVKSISGMNILPPEDVVTYQTNRGEMTIREILSESDFIITHVLPESTVDAFRQKSVIDDASEYIMNNAVANSRSSNKTLDEDIDSIIDRLGSDLDPTNKNDDVLYIPMLKSEFNILENVVEDPDGENLYKMPDSQKSAFISVVGGEMRISSLNAGKSYNIESDTGAYISARLDDEVSEVALPYESHDDLPILSNGGLELIETIKTCNI